MADKRVPSAERPAFSFWLIWLVAAVALTAHLFAAAKYSNWTWGFNQFYFLNTGLVAVITLLGCALCLPWVWTSMPGIRRPGKSSALFSTGNLVVAAIAAIVFWLLRTPYHFLGDGRLMIRLLDQGKWFHASEPLDRLIHYAVLLAGRPLFGWDATLAYAAASVAAGFAYVLAALRLGAILRHKVFVTAALLSLGTIELFCGYAESYSLATVAILVYALLALEFLAGQRRFIWVGVALAVGVALHVALLFLVPSFVYLMLARRDKEAAPEAPPAPSPGDARAASARAISRRSRPNLVAGIAFLALVAVLVAAVSSRGTGGLLLLPIARAGGAQYALFSWQHLVDFLNEQVLVSPLAWIAFLGFLYAFRGDPSIGKSRRFRFLLAASAGGILFNLVIRPDLGGSRDWDLWSMGALAYAVTVVVWIAHNMGRRAEARFAAFVLVVVGVLHVSPWIAINHSRELSLDRYTRMLEGNPLWTERRLASAASELAHFYIEVGADQQAVPLLEQAVRQDPRTARYWDALGVAYIGLKRFAEAERPLRRAIELEPGDHTAYNNLGRAYQGAGRLDDAEAAFKKSIELDPTSGVPFFNLGKVYIARGDTAAALESYKQATSLMPYAPEYWYTLATLSEAAGQRDQAVIAWQRVAALAEGDPAQEKARRIALDHLEELGKPGTHY